MRIMPLSINSSNNSQNNINFKSNSLNKHATETLETVVIPFLKEYDPKTMELWNEAHQYIRGITQKIPKLQPEVSPAEFREAKRLRLGEFDANEKEFSYLHNKAHQWFAGKEAPIIADEMMNSANFEVPFFLRGAFAAYKKLQMDINNGLANMTLNKLAPDIAQKKEALAGARLGFGVPYIKYGKVENYAKDLQKMVEEDTLTEPAFDIIESTIRTNIFEHKQELPEIKSIIEEARATYKANQLTPEDEEVLSGLHLPAQRVISRNVSKFNNEVRGIELNEDREYLITETLNNQKRALERLWNSIEWGKKQTFAKQIETPIERPITEYPDDLPF